MSRGRIGKNLIAATIHHALAKLVGFLVVLLLARFLAKSDLGQFFFVFSVAQIASVFAEVGTNQYLIRRLAMERTRPNRSFGEVASLRAPLIVAVFLLLNAGFYLFAPSMVPIMLLASTAVLLRETYYLFGALFIGKQLVKQRALTEIAGNLGLLVAVYLTVSLSGGGLLGVLSAFCVVHGALLLGAAVWAWVLFGPPSLDWNVKRSIDVLRAGLPFFGLTAIGIAHLKVDAVMLGLLADFEVLAGYEVAHKFIEVSQFLVRPLQMIFLPIAAALVADRALSKLRPLASRLLLWSVGGALLLAAGLWVLADPVIRIVFGELYTASADLLRVLVLAIPALYVILVGTFLGAALHLERVVVRFAFGALLLNVTLNAVAIPVWGATGAAWTTVITAMFYALAVTRLVSRGLRSAGSSSSRAPTVGAPSLDRHGVRNADEAAFL